MPDQPHYNYAHQLMLKALPIIDDESADDNLWGRWRRAWQTELVHLRPEAHLDEFLAARFKRIVEIFENEDSSQYDLEIALGNLRQLASQLDMHTGQRKAAYYVSPEPQQKYFPDNDPPPFDRVVWVEFMSTVLRGEYFAKLSSESERWEWPHGREITHKVSHWWPVEPAEDPGSS